MAGPAVEDVVALVVATAAGPLGGMAPAAKAVQIVIDGPVAAEDVAAGRRARQYSRVTLLCDCRKTVAYLGLRVVNCGFPPPWERHVAL